MSIKTKQGKIFKLRGPNPLTRGQEEWRRGDKLIFHNLRWEPVTFAGLVHPPIDEEEPVIEEPVIEEPPPLSIPQVKEPEPTENRKIKNVVVMHCLPATIRRTKDELYGEVSATIQYGSKFIFEGVIVNSADLGMQFWTSVELAEGSIVYPSRYRDGVKFGDYRWWKVVETEKKAGGFLVEAIISNYQPAFSD